VRVPGWRIQAFPERHGLTMTWPSALERRLGGCCTRLLPQCLSPLARSSSSVPRWAGPSHIQTLAILSSGSLFSEKRFVGKKILAGPAGLRTPIPQWQGQRGLGLNQPRLLAHLLPELGLSIRLSERYSMWVLGLLTVPFLRAAQPL